MKSSIQSGDQILGAVSQAAAERFLLDLANFRGKTETAARLVKRNRGICADIKVDFEQESPDAAQGWFEITVLQRRLRKAWDAPDARSREWYCFQLRARFWRWEKRDDQGLQALLQDPNVRAIYEDAPPETPFEAVMFYFSSVIGSRAKHCANSTCPAPYFIAQKRAQKYCSAKCTGPAQREAKRRWWAKRPKKSGAR